MKQTNKVMQKIELIEFVTSLKLEPEERNSLVYSNGISTEVVVMIKKQSRG